MPKPLKLFILGILLSLYSFCVNASDISTSPANKPGFIPIIKKPCYIGCDYMFKFCYYYNISNAKDAITVKEWNVEKNFVTGKAVADIKAKLLIKVCYQLSLTSAYPVVEQDLNLESEFGFKIKINENSKNRCIEFQEDAITYYSFEFKGDLNTDPIPLMQGQLEQDLAEIIQNSVSKAVYESIAENKKGNKVYCAEKQNNTYEDNAPCRCD